MSENSQAVNSDFGVIRKNLSAHEELEGALNAEEAVALGLLQNFRQEGDLQFEARVRRVDALGEVVHEALPHRGLERPPRGDFRGTLRPQIRKALPH